MISIIIIFAALILEITIGGFLGVMKGTFPIYAVTFIITAFIVKKENITRLSFASGLIADIFLSSLNFFGFFLILYFILGYFIVWLRTIFLKTNSRAVILFRFIPAIILYQILYMSFGGIKSYFSDKTTGINGFFSTNFFIGEILGVLSSTIIFMVIWLILKNKNA